MLQNGNFLGSYDLGKQNWSSGILDMRSHAAMKYSGRFPDYPVLPDDITVGNANDIGPFKNQSVSIATQEGTSTGLYLSNDGVYMFVVGTTNDTLYKYTLSTPYEITTATFTSSFAFGTTVVDPASVYVSPDGTKVFVLSTTTDIIHSYTMLTPWSTVGMTYDAKTFTLTTQEATPLGITFKPDGTKFWAIGSTADTVFEYTMSTPWDLATAAYASVSLSLSGLDTVPASICWNSTGTRFFVLGRTNSRLLAYAAVTPWTVSGVTTGSGYIYNQGTNPTLATSVTPVYTLTASRTAYLIPGTDNLYVNDATSDRVFRFKTGVVDDVISAKNIGYCTADSSSIVVGSGETLRGIYFKPDGTRFWVGNSLGLIREYLCATPFSSVGATLVQSTPRLMIDSATTQVGSGFTTIAFSADGLWFYQVASTNSYMTQWALLEPWDLSSALYFVSGSATAIGAGSSRGTFSKDGTKFFYVFSGTTTFNTIYMKTLSKPWDLSTISATATSVSVADVTGTAGYLTGGIAITEDGKYLYGTTYSTTTRIYKWKMTTPFDLSTLQFMSVAFEEDTSPNPVNICINRDGSRVILLDSTNNTVRGYTIA